MSPRRMVVGLTALGVAVAGVLALTGAPEPATAQSSPSIPAPVLASAPASVAQIQKATEPRDSMRDSAADAVRVLLIPAFDTTVSSPVAGRIRSIDSTLGASFPAGKVLVAFDCDEQTARMNMAKAELSGAHETHEAKLRLRGLDQASDVEVALAASAADKAKAQLALASTQVGQCEIRAPWAGRIAKLHVRNYMTITAGQPLLDLVKTGPLKVKLSVPSKWLAWMKPGVRFGVAIDETGKKYQAKVALLNSRVDPVSQTIEIEADMTENYPELLAGMSGTARFETPAAR